MLAVSESPPPVGGVNWIESGVGGKKGGGRLKGGESHGLAIHFWSPRTETTKYGSGHIVYRGARIVLHRPPCIATSGVLPLTADKLLASLGKNAVVRLNREGKLTMVIDPETKETRRRLSWSGLRYSSVADEVIRTGLGIES